MLSSEHPRSVEAASMILTSLLGIIRVCLSPFFGDSEERSDHVAVSPVVGRTNPNFPEGERNPVTDDSAFRPPALQKFSIIKTKSRHFQTFNKSQNLSKAKTEVMEGLIPLVYTAIVQQKKGKQGSQDLRLLDLSSAPRTADSNSACKNQVSEQIHVVRLEHGYAASSPATSGTKLSPPLASASIIIVSSGVQSSLSHLSYRRVTV